MPKRGVNLHDNEITRAFKTVNDTWIEPISFVVPRRAEVFQDDIYPPCTGLKPAVSGKEWFDGQTGLPPKISLESVYDGKTPVEVASKYTPRETPIQSPPATKTEAPKPKPEPVPEPLSRGPPPKMEDSKASISAMANKFADKDAEESSEDDASSFEEVAKPVTRPAAVVATKQEDKPANPVITREPPKEQPKVASPVKALASPTFPFSLSTSSLKNII